MFVPIPGASSIPSVFRVWKARFDLTPKYLGPWQADLCFMSDHVGSISQEDKKDKKDKDKDKDKKDKKDKEDTFCAEIMHKKAQWIPMA